MSKWERQMFCWIAPLNAKQTMQTELNLQGVGAPDAVLSAVERGVDIFDSGYAHRATAAGAALTFAAASPASDGATPASASGSHSAEFGQVAASQVAAGGAQSSSDSRDTVGECAAAMDLWDVRHRASTAPLLPGCSCYTCTRWVWQSHL